MTATLDYVIERCKVKELAAKASSFEEMCRLIGQELENYRRELYNKRGIEYITINPQMIYSTDPETLLWVFMLLNPVNPFRKHLDPRRESLLKKALAADPAEFESRWGYSIKKISEKLQCIGDEGSYISKYWEILPVYTDAARKNINVSYLIQKNRWTESAAEIYACYALCTEEEAERTIQKYLSKDAGELYDMYPGGRLEFMDDELVMQVHLSREEGRAAWLAIEHPFFIANCVTPKHSAEIFFDFLAKSIHRDVLHNAYGYRDHHILYRGLYTTGHETRDKIEFIRRENYSYHDGGGGTEDSFYMIPLSEEKRKSLIIPNEMMTKEYYRERKLFMPPCDGYWEQEGVIYLMNPFDMKDAFIWGYTDISWD